MTRARCRQALIPNSTGYWRHPSPRHHAAQGKFLKGVWGLAAGADFLWASTKGDRPVGAKLVQPYMDLMLEGIHADPELMRALIPVFHLIEPIEQREDLLGLHPLLALPTWNLVEW